MRNKIVSHGAAHTTSHKLQIIEQGKGFDNFHHLNPCFEVPFIYIGVGVSNLLYTATVIFKE